MFCCEQIKIKLNVNRLETVEVVPSRSHSMCACGKCSFLKFCPKNKNSSVEILIFLQTIKDCIKVKHKILRCMHTETQTQTQTRTRTTGLYVLRRVELKWNQPQLSYLSTEM